MPSLGPVDWKIVVVLVCFGGSVLLIVLFKALMRDIDRRG
jgi:hypothetical protein